MSLQMANQIQSLGSDPSEIDRKSGGRRSTPWFMGIDLGTGSCKCLVTDEHALPLGFGSSDYPAKAISSRWLEQDPNAAMLGMLQAVRLALSAANVAPSDCSGVSIGCALHGIMAVDRSGNPISGVVTWADDRASKQAQWARDSDIFQSLYDQTGCPIHWMYPLYKILWWQQIQPDVFDHAARFITLKEYVLQRLTGEYVVDYGMASGSGLLNTHTLDWAEEICALIGIRREHLSPTLAPLTVLPMIRSDLVTELGLPAGAQIYLGSSDAANSSLGAGAVQPWQATCMVGTSGALRVISSLPVLDPKHRSWCYAIDRNHWLIGGAINNGGLAVAWLRDLLNGALSTQTPHAELSFEDLIALASEVKPGADGLICLPFFAGERSPNWNLNARGAFFGLTLNHDARHLSRALLEGIAFRLRSLDDVLQDIAIQCTQIRASGGFTHSPLWLQIIASALNRELIVPTTGETSSLGAALWAMHGAGAVASLEDIGRLVPVMTSYQAIPEQTQVYSRIYPLYCELYQAASPFFAALASLSQDELTASDPERAVY